MKSTLTFRTFATAILVVITLLLAIALLTQHDEQVEFNHARKICDKLGHRWVKTPTGFECVIYKGIQA